jgi:hypothetical protein
MSGFFKKLIATGTVLTIGLANVAFADTVCCPPSVGLPPFGGEPICGPSVASCGPCSGWCDNICFYGSWLYWKVNGDEFDYAVEKKRIQNDFIRDHETFHNLRFDWDSGFRLGAGVEFPCLSWGLDVLWTHYESSSSKSKRINATQGSTQTFVSLPAVYNFGDQLVSSESAIFTGRLKFRYNTVDFEFSRWCCCNGCVTFRPHIGIRIADLQESFHDKVVFNNGAFETFSLTEATDGRFFTKNRFKGAGVRAGLDLDLCLCEGWSFIGRGAASIVWGRTHITQHFKYSRISEANFYHGDIHDSYRQSRVITDLSFGIRYKTLACCCYPVFVELAWEHHYLFNFHRFWVDNSFFSQGSQVTSLPNSQLLTTSSWKKNGDLALQGLTLTFGISF